MGKISILIADDHPVFQEGLARLIEEEEDLEVVGKAKDGEETVRLAKELMPDIAIIDISMPKLSGLEAAKQIKSFSSNTAILIISAYDYESYVVGALQIGAAGYLLKNVSLHDLISAIYLIYNGEGVFDLKAMPYTRLNLIHRGIKAKQDIVHLHQRELQVLKLAAKGMSNKEIAHELIISERTVQTHLKNTFARLGVNSRTEAVIAALKKGWLSLDNLSDIEST